MRQRLFCASLVLVACAGRAPAQTALDLIPADAMAGLAIRSIDDLTRKGDRFIKDTGMKVPLRPSQIFDMLFQQIGVKEGIDDKAPAAIILVNEKVVGQALGLRSLEKYLVVALPCKDVDKVAEGLGVKKGDLKPGVPVACTAPAFMGARCCVRGKHLFLGGLDKALLSVIKGRTLAAELTAAQRQKLGNSDMVLHLGILFWHQGWRESALKSIEQEFQRKGDEAEHQAAATIVKALAELRFAVAGLRLDGGLGVNVVSVFPKDGKDSKKFLTTLRGGDGASTLRGLPATNAVAAWAGKGDGSKNAVLARVLFRFLLTDFLETNRFTTVTERTTFLGLFNEVWQRLRGSRIALYKTANERQHGLFGVVGILDTEDPQKFLDELKQFARFGSPEGLDLTSEATKEANRADIEKLVGNLSARRFALRESATTKLLLVGEPALPFLEKALKSKDLEVSRRAERIKRAIVQGVEERRKLALSKDLTRLVKPSFAFLPKDEDIDGVKVRLVAVKLSKRDAAYAAQLKQLLGPQWNRIRLAVHGKQVVVLAGSDVKLLSETLKNLKEGKAGLAETAALKEFVGRSDPRRKMELHLSLQTGVALWTAADLEKPGTLKPGEKLTSIALTVEPDRVQLDVWIPSSEFKVLNRAGGW